MYATGLGDRGVYYDQTGVEANSCHDYVAQPLLDNFTGEDPDGSWTSWLSGYRDPEPPNSPAYNNWSSYPTSGYAGEN